MAVWLFGSRARRKNRKDSDIDLAICLRGRDHNTRMGRWMARRRWMTPINLPVAIDLEFFDPNEISERVGPAVKREGVPLYVREP